MFILAIIIIIVGLFFIDRYNRIQKHKKLGLNGPKPNIILGNLDELIKTIYFVSY